MRFVSVLGAIGVGLAIGSAAVLAPLTMGTSRTGIASPSGSGQLGSKWGEQAMRFARSLISPPKETSRTATTGQTSLSGALIADAVVPAPGQPGLGQDAKTIDYLAHSATTHANVADARIVQTPWQTQVTVSPEAAPKKLTSSKPSSDEQRQSLVRDLQAELKRVGCYEGEPNGQWGAASKKAMAAFTDRVNASLPFEQPDFILLTLVQGHKGRACGQDCPAGQGLADNGRCTPTSILAQAERSKLGDAGKRDNATLAAAATAAAVSSAGTADDGKSKFRPARQGQSAIASAWTTTTVEAPLETGSVPPSSVPAPVRVVRPQVAAVAPAAAKTISVPANEPAQSSRPATVLPGRMAIGAPILEATPVPAVRPAPQARIAAASPVESATEATAEPVTAAHPVAIPAPQPKRVVRREPPAPAQAVPHAVKRVPEPVAIRRPPPAPRYSPPQYSGNPYGINTSGSKSRRMIYEMFQRADRN